MIGSKNINIAVILTLPTNWNEDQDSSVIYKFDTGVFTKKGMHD
jgi:hypothetical protein